MVGDPPLISSALIDANFVVERNQFYHLRMDTDDDINNGKEVVVQREEEEDTIIGVCRNNVNRV
ncbi:hypothetical protein GYH30_035278 [Glycine max]|nr:hypothetical protein GYH30_035278 [Glycine max]